MKIVFMKNRFGSGAMRIALSVLVVSVLGGNRVGAGVVLDFRADDPGIVTNGTGNVTLWPDQAQGLNATAEPGTSTPTLTNVTINGLSKPALNFNGSQKLITGAITTPPTGSMFVVLNNNYTLNTYNSRTLGWEDNASGSSGLALIPSAEGGTLYVVARQNGANADVAGTPRLGTGFEIVSITWGSAGVTVHRTNTAGLTSLVGTKTNVTGISATPGVTALHIGDSALGQNDYFQGNITELVAYNNQLSSVERAGVESRLYNTWFTTGVPEPTSLALLGLGGLAVLRRRRA
jgi:hypothetical protein